MRKFAFVFAIVLMFALQAAANYSQTYVIGGWLSVSRLTTVTEDDGCPSVTDACADTGAVFPPSMGTQRGTQVQLVFQNIGPSDRNGISITESLAYVPSGAQMAYLPNPSSTDGRSATWEVGALRRGSARSLTYSFDAVVEQGDIERIPAVSGVSAEQGATLSAPRAVKVGERVTIKARSQDGQALSGARIIVSYPDGSSMRVGTDSSGTASFTALREGFYTYSVEGYTLLSLASTEAWAAAQVPPAAGAAVNENEGLVSAFASLLPILAGIFVIAVVALIAYNFFAARKEEEEGGYSQQPAVIRPSAQPLPKRTEPHGPPVVSTTGGMGQYSGQQPKPAKPSYSQQYTFGAAQKAQEKPEQREIETRRLVESRTNEDDFSGRETTTSNDEEVERELAQLERQARTGGENTSEEREIEKAIAELEAIRQKLRERKGEMEELSVSMERGEEAEETQEPGPATAVRKFPAQQRARYEKPERKARVLPPKKKLKITTKGVKRR